MPHEPTTISGTATAMTVIHQRARSPHRPAETAMTYS
jgi:hypothetical protein